MTDEAAAIERVQQLFYAKLAAEDPSSPLIRRERYTVNRAPRTPADSGLWIIERDVKIAFARLIPRLYRFRSPYSAFYSVVFGTNVRMPGWYRHVETELRLSGEQWLTRAQRSLLAELRAGAYVRRHISGAERVVYPGTRGDDDRLQPRVTAELLARGLIRETDDPSGRPNYSAYVAIPLAELQPPPKKEKV